MVRNIFLQILLSPFAILFGIGVTLKNILYSVGLLKGLKYSIPVINIGNLTVGGAGKTPHTEYLIRLLKEYISVATLSRGYQRKSKGFMLVQPRHNATIAGDEPLQYKRKFPDITVAVSESRSLGIPKLMQQNPGIQTILLDDAYQHRSVDPALNILLTEYGHLFTQDYLLPIGRLREWRSAYRRAHRMIVTKCPADLTQNEADKITQDIRPLAHQKLYFSRYKYHHPYYIFNPSYRILLEEEVDVLLVCAIARTTYLEEYVSDKVKSLKTLQYEDHHTFTSFDLGQIQRHFEQIESDKKLILTTEKDAMRLELHRAFLHQKEMPVFALPIEVEFLFNQKEAFDADIQDFLLKFKS
jgi:tetraacyldisaccharide 4'-kinase